MTELRAAIVREWRSWLDTPWLHQHRTKGIGVDCAGVLVETCKTLGLSTFDLVGYDRMPDGNALIDLCDEQMTRIPIAHMQPADAVVMKFDLMPQHLALITPYREGVLAILHGNTQIGRVVEHRLDVYWRSLIVAAYRLPRVPA